MPDRGGCRTVLRAWSRDTGSGFSQSLVEVKDKSKGLKVSEGLGRRATGVLDLPHGFAVKIAASVNVFVVYSAAAGKIWVMAAKAKESGEDSSKLSPNSAKSEQFSAKLEVLSAKAKSDGCKGKLESFKGNSAKFPGLSDKLESLKDICGNFDGLKSSGKDRVCISLIKCSVVDCNGPVYSIRVSLQNMILGEDYGVRVWALRPLVKGRPKNRAVVGEKGKDGVIMNKFGGLDKGNLQGSCVESGPKVGGLDQGNPLEGNLQPSTVEDGRKIGVPKQNNLQVNSVEVNLQANSAEGNSQANSAEGSLQVSSAENGWEHGTLDQLNLQAYSVEGYSQLNSVANGWKIRVLDRVNSLENGREEMCLVKGGKQVTEGEELVLGSLVKVGNVENKGKETKGRETIVSNGGERVNGKGVRIGKVCEKTNDRKASSDLGEKDLDEKLDNGEKAGLALKRPPRNGVIEDAIGCFKDVSEIYCNGAKMGAVSAASLHRGMLVSSCKGSIDNVVNLTNGGQCNCTNVLSSGATVVGFQMGNLVNCTLSRCEAKSLASKRSDGQLCAIRATALDDSSTQQQLSQQSYSSSASSSLSGSVGSLSVSMSASASSACVFPSTFGSTQSSEGTIHAPVSSLLVKSRPLKMRETLGKVCSIFVPFEDAGKEGNKASRLRAIAIHDLSQTKFVVLDSAGDLHFLSLHNLVSTGDSQKEQDCDIAGHCLRHLKSSLKVNMFAAFPEMASSTSQKLWVSDGRHSIHLLSFPSANASPGESDKDLAEENPLQLSVIQAVFSSDRIHAIAAMSANASLVLTQGSIIT
ncbi:hypothetical protein KI387_027687, partial [Taxus chinensis]